MQFSVLSRAPQGDMQVNAIKMSLIRGLRYHFEYKMPVLGSNKGDLVSLGCCPRHLHRAAYRLARLQPDDRTRCFAGVSEGDSIASTETHKNSNVLTLPTILTLARVVAIPLLMASWFCEWWTACAVLFLGASITDFFDGYLARKLVRSLPHT